MRLVMVVVVHAPEVVVERLARLLDVTLLQHLQLVDAVEAKAAEVLAKLAPRGERPGAAPEE
jgi:hypothetical protein